MQLENSCTICYRLGRKHCSLIKISPSDECKTRKKKSKVRSKKQIIYTVPSILTPTPLHKIHLIHNYVDSSWCDMLREETERLNAWGTNRHANFPTTDIPVSKLSKKIRFQVLDLLQKRIFPDIEKMFVLENPLACEIIDLFVVRYLTPGGQSELKKHRDGSTISFSILLNSCLEFQGGGTYFYALSRAIHARKGSIIFHCGKLKHAGKKIRSGRRYLLVGFVKCHSPSILDGKMALNLRQEPSDDTYLHTLYIQKPSKYELPFDESCQERDDAREGSKRDESMTANKATYNSGVVGI